MKTFYDCIPCFLRQSLDSVRMITADKAIHEHLLREVLASLAKMDLRQSPPAIGKHIHRLIRELTGQDDPYREVKAKCNQMALDLYCELQQRVEESDNPLDMAIRLAVAGNVIDLGVNSSLADEDVHEAIDHAIDAPLNMDLQAFQQAITGAETILYLADNAGEIVFDKLLICQLPTDKVTVAVRGAPTINDATMADAEAVGLTELVNVIDNGSDAPGTILGDCSSAFRQAFSQANLVIAKGQGNYETLSEVSKDIFFILKAKCPVIATDLSCELGSLVVRRSNFAAALPEKGTSDARL